MTASEKIAPCGSCGGKLWNIERDGVGITFTCIVCGTCRYTDIRGAAVAVEQSEELSGYEVESDLSPRSLGGIVCTVVRVFRREREPSLRGRLLWDTAPTGGVHAVAVYHTRSRLRQKYPRTVRWVEVLPPLEEDLDEASLARFKKAVYLVLEEAWGKAGAFNVKARLDLQRWGYSLGLLGGEAGAHQWRPRVTRLGTYHSSLDKDGSEVTKAEIIAAYMHDYYLIYSTVLGLGERVRRRGWESGRPGSH